MVTLEVFKVFFLALFLTICVTIYLSDSIIRPIRKLAAVAKEIDPSRRKKIIVPQFSDRNDEINDLAVALKNMLNSLLERMDAIVKSKIH